MQEQLTLFAADTHANPSAKPGRSSANKTHGTSGRRCTESFEKHAPAGSWPKMFADTLASVSTRWPHNWRMTASPSGRLLYQLALSMPRTAAKDSGLWPTPKASDAIMGMTANCSDRAPEKSTHLQAQVAISIDWKPGDGKMNPLWLEWLMGFPLGWTELEPSATQLSLKSPNVSGEQ